MFLRSALFLYIVLMPFLHALTPIPVAAFNSGILLMVSPLVLIGQPRYQLASYPQTAIVIGLAAYGLLAWSFYPVGIQFSRIQGSLQWGFSLFGLWILTRRWIAVSGISFRQVSFACTIGAVGLSLATFAEFILSNSAGIFFSDLLPFSIVDFPQATVFGSVLQRPRVFSAEAGFTAMSFELFLPLSFFYVRELQRVLALTYWSLCVIAVILLSSTGAILSIAIATIFYFAMGSRSLGVRLVVPTTVLATLVFVTANADSTTLPIYKIYEFFDPTNYTNAEGSRQEAIRAASILFKENFFGIGWGTVLQETKIPGSEIDQLIYGTGLISLWLELAVATGFLGLLAMLGIVLQTLWRLIRLQQVEATLCFLALCSLAFHHVSVFELWFPMFWFALALSEALIADSRHLARQDNPAFAAATGMTSVQP